MVQQLKETHSDQEQNEILNHLNKASASKPLSWPRLFSLSRSMFSCLAKSPANRKQLCSALPAPSSGGDEDFASIGIFDFGSGGKAANIDITGVGRIRTNHESRFVWHRNAIGEICSRPLRGHTGRNSSSHWFRRPRCFRFF